MRKRDRIKLKKESLEKWKKIVEDLKHKAIGIFGFSTEDCGYCLSYIQTHKYGYPDFRNCVKCPLCNHTLCGKGKGIAYKTVLDFYNDLPNNYSRVDHTEQSNVLKQAQKMLCAIQNDITQETNDQTT